MRPHGTYSGTSKPGGRLALVGAAAAAAVLAVPLTAPASTHSFRTSAATKPAAVVLGGVTAQGGPVVLEMSRNGRQVVRAVSSLRLTCTSGAIFTLFDGYQKLPVKNRKFSLSFGPQVVRNADGTTTDLEGSISGTLNKARSRATGRWQFKGTDRDAAGVVTDTCDSGAISWSAKQ
jgi:hypothetical protein